MKKSQKAIIIILALILFATVATSLAYMFKISEENKNTFTPAIVDCEMTGNGASKVTIENTGSINAYLRIRIVTYWEKDDVIISESSPDFTVNGKEDNWLEGSDNTYYYDTAVEPKAIIVFCESITLEQKDGYTAVIKIFGEAMQYLPQTAAENSWQVTIDTNGTITSVK
ncbi:MAG: hypothetical protein IJP20_02295 [Clostridia bacterium]|nr:hypothetical protein [Clostridia bacterium]